MDEHCTPAGDDALRADTAAQSPEIPEPEAPSPLRVLTAMFGSGTAVGVALGLSIPLFSVVLSRMGVDSALVGLNTSVGIGATIVAAPMVPWLLRWLGAVALMFWGLVLSAVALLIAGYLHDVWLWFVLRFVIGYGLALQWVISETWINDVAADKRRGFIAGMYSTLMGVGFAIGPAILGYTGSDGIAPFAISAAIVLLAGLPFYWVRGAAPAMDHAAGQSTLGVLRRAPVIMLASVISGFVDTATLALLPIYGLDVGMDEPTAVLQLTVATLGAVALQLPIGWLADRFGRRNVLAGCALVKTITVLLLPSVLAMPWLLWPLLFVWGGAMIAFYTLALALVGARFRGETLAKATSALVITYCAGSVIGPLAIGAAMDALGPNGFVIGMAAVSGLLAVVAVMRLRAERF